MMREEGVPSLEFLHNSALRRALSVPPAQKNTSRSGAAAKSAPSQLHDYDNPEPRSTSPPIRFNKR